MTDPECVALLQWALPMLNLRWQGYRNVRGQVCKRIRRRISELGSPDVVAYRARLESDPAEWQVLRSLCGITISRFYRDRGVWDRLRAQVLPVLAEAARTAGDELRCWSLGCASGEEPYTLSIVWKLALASRYPGVRLRILATDADPRVLERAERAEYAAATLLDLPQEWREQAFEERAGAFRLREAFRDGVELRCQDVRLSLADEIFRLILCRNLVCTYFDEALQQRTLERLVTRMANGAAFVLGRHERLPPGTALRPWLPQHAIYAYGEVGQG